MQILFELFFATMFSPEGFAKKKDFFCKDGDGSKSEIIGSTVFKNDVVVRVCGRCFKNEFVSLDPSFSVVLFWLFGLSEMILALKKGGKLMILTSMLIVLLVILDSFINFS